MAGAHLLAVQWLLACLGSAATGMAAWLLLAGAARLWPALRTHRAVWLAAQCVVAVAVLLPFLPHRPQIDIAAQIDLGPPPAALLAPGAVERGAAAGNAGLTATPPLADSASIQAGDSDVAEPSNASQLLVLMAEVWLGLYTIGLACSVTRQLRARRLWRGLLTGARQFSPAELQAHGAFTAGQLRDIAGRKLIVLRTDAAISPLLIGVRQPRLLLPSHLDALTVTQQQMIVAHELHHWRVGDPLCLAIASVLQAIFWFNPSLRWMARQMSWALELRCDQQVLAGRPQQQRKQYAASLLQQWSLMAPAGVAAFNGATIAARIRHMQKDGLPALSKAAAWLTAAALSAVLVIGALLQPALAFSIAAAPPTGQQGPAPVPEAWRPPLDKVRVTSFFGVQRSILPTPHKGVDFGAAKGTPVHATASGTVIAAGPLAENHGRYGNAVIIDHGAQRSLYAHLDSVSVKPGQHVQAGQLIGAVGQSGFATGPHLHLEVRQDGQLIDPATRLTSLDAYATARALKVRRQQLPSKG
jgi:murein DD-endopeptidase MepM/ murein hydrolase activator NlpD